MTPEEAKTTAENHFKSGLNCAQAVTLTFAKDLGMDENTIKTLSQPFGGGMCRMREVCGTVSGMMLCIGMIQNAQGNAANGASTPEGKSNKDNTYEIGQDFARQFREINGSIICKELLGLAPMTKTDNPVSEARTETYYKKRPCAELCGIAAEIVAKYIESQKNQAQN